MSTLGNDDPIRVTELATAVPWWPFSRHTTYRLIRNGQLRAVVVGRHRFVTVALLREFVDRHTPWVKE